MRTKSIRLTEAEAAELRDYLALTGETEASVLKRAALRGLRDLRIEQGILAHIQGRGSSDGSAIAGLLRGEFLQLLVDRGVTVLAGPSTLPGELEHLGNRLGNRKLLAVAEKLAAEGG